MAKAKSHRSKNDAGHQRSGKTRNGVRVGNGAPSAVPRRALPILDMSPRSRVESSTPASDGTIASPGFRAASGGFCAAPWIETVIRIDGTVSPCCRTDVVFGTTKQESLSNIWRGSVARAFRLKVATGEYPSQACVQCHQDGKATTLYKDFDDLISIHWRTYEQGCEQAGSLPSADLCSAIQEFAATVRNFGDNDVSGEPCRRFIFVAFACRRDPLSAEAKTALRQLCKVARVCLDYFEKKESPKMVGTLREVNLVAICNASCVHCIGFHTSEISQGLEVDGRRYKRMPVDRIRQAFERTNDMSLFFMNGSEFLLYAGWRQLVEDFSRNGVLIALATNGMLLDEAASRHLISHNVLRDVNFSFDGARRETVEAIRQNVRYDVLLNNLRAFLRVLEDSRLRSVLTVDLSMVLLKANVREAPELVRLVDSIRGDRELTVVASFQVLNASDNPSYRGFYERERMDIDDPIGRTYLERAAMVGEALGVPTYYSYTGTLRRALEQGALRSTKSSARANGGVAASPTAGAGVAPKGISVVTPAGYRVEGLTVDDAAVLLRALQ